MLFQQDNAPCHTSKKSKSWFERKNIEVLEWPGNSLDLNHIKNLWGNNQKKNYKAPSIKFARIKIGYKKTMERGNNSRCNDEFSKFNGKKNKKYERK